MENFDKKLNNYARLIIEKGINANDRPLVIRCAVERADFARLLVKYAYEKVAAKLLWNGMTMQSTECTTKTHQKKL